MKPNDGKSTGRYLVRALLGVVLALASGIAVYALASLRGESAVQWVIVAAALAVLASTVSAFASLRVVELEEDRRKPHVAPVIDVYSRYGLVLLAIQNKGGSPAHSVQIEWDSTPTNDRGDSIAVETVATLHPGESIYRSFGSSTQFFKKEPVDVLSGKISYTDGAGRDYAWSFELDPEVHRHAPYHTDEAQKTHHDLQKIPERLKDISDAIAPKLPFGGRTRRG